MNGPFMVQKRRNRRNDDIFKVIKGLVGTIENLQEDLHGVLDDVKILLRQIDLVTDKIEEDYSHRHDSSGKVPDRNRLLRNRHKLDDDARLDEVSPDLDLSYLTITPDNHRTKWGRSLLESPKFPSVKDNCKSASISPLAFSNNEHCFEYHVTRNDKVSVNLIKKENHEVRPDKQNLFRRLSNAITEIEETSPKHCVKTSSVATCYAQFKQRGSSKPEPLIPQKEQSVINSKNKETNSCEKSLQTFCCENCVRDSRDNCTTEIRDNLVAVTNDNSDDDIYEKLMESQLERMSATSDFSDRSELSDNYMDLGTFSASDVSYSDGTSVQYDREINPWTSYTLHHATDSTKSSESFVSDTPSDILNENTKSATLTLADMIFSDQLVRASNRQKLKHIINS